jgi:hypothetical protein
MKLVDAFEAMLGRMTSRERRLFAGLATVIGVAIVAGVVLAMSAIFGSIQEDIDHGRAVLAESRAVAPKYKELSDRRKAMEDAIRANRSTARSMVNDILKKQLLSGEVPGALGDTMADIVSFEGKTNDTPVEVGKARKKTTKAKSKEPATGILQIEQGLEFKEVPQGDLMAFLDSVEQGKDLLFVTKIDASRKFNDMAHVRAVVTVATYQFQGAADEAPADGGEAAGVIE